MCLQSIINNWHSGLYVYSLVVVSYIDGSITIIVVIVENAPTRDAKRDKKHKYTSVYVGVFVHIAVLIF